MSQKKSKDSTSASAAAVALGLGGGAAALDTANANVRPEQSIAPDLAGSNTLISNVSSPELTNAADQSLGLAEQPTDDLVGMYLDVDSAGSLEQVALLDANLQNLIPEPELLRALAMPEDIQLAQADVVAAGVADVAGTTAMGAGSAGLAGAAGVDSGLGMLGTLAGGALGAGGVAAIVNNQNNQNDTVSSES